MVGELTCVACVVGAIAILAMLLWVVWSQSGGVPARYRSRPCAGRQWRRCFPEAPKDDIRLFLECFVHGMLYPSNRRLLFTPEDKVMEVYRSNYFRWSSGDHFELEAFGAALCECFPVVAWEDYDAALSNDASLGDLFAMTRERAA